LFVISILQQDLKIYVKSLKDMVMFVMCIFLKTTIQDLQEDSVIFNSLMKEMQKKPYKAWMVVDSMEIH